MYSIEIRNVIKGRKDMTVNSDLRDALKTWKKSELTEMNEAPILFRLVGVVIVSVSTVLAVLM